MSNEIKINKQSLTWLYLLLSFAVTCLVLQLIFATKKAYTEAVAAEEKRKAEAELTQKLSEQLLKLPTFEMPKFERPAFKKPDFEKKFEKSSVDIGPVKNLQQ